jgi:hypothetical protein
MTEFLLGVDEQAIAAETLRLRRRRRAIAAEAVRPNQDGTEVETGTPRPSGRRS